MEPVARQMTEMGCPFRGILYGGIMITDEGPRVFEFNCRMGDPEAQVVIPRLKTDLLDIALATVEGRLSECRVEWATDSWVGVVMASEGYPGSYETGLEVTGIPAATDESIVFHAGTRLEDDKTRDVRRPSPYSGGPRLRHIRTPDVGHMNWRAR